MLAFPGSPALLDQAKIGVLTTSVIAAMVGLTVLVAATGRQPQGPLIASSCNSLEEFMP